MDRQFEYRQELDDLRFTPEQKTQMAARAAQAAAETAALPAKRTRHRPIARTAVIAAVVAVLLAVGAGATGVLRPVADVFGPIFGGSAAQTEVIDKIGYPIGASDTDNGVTITADAIIGDQYNACIVYTITREDGTALLPEGTEDSMLMGGTGGADLSIRGGTHGSAWFADEDPTDNTLQMVQTISADVPINDCTATAEFNGLYRWDDAAGERVPIVEGTWKFKFDVAYEDSSVTLGHSETFEQDGMTFTINAVTVSPVAVKVDYTVDHEVQWSNAPSGKQSGEDAEQMRRHFENVEILLTKTDGTMLDLSNSGGSVSPENGTTVCSKGQVLDQIIPLDQLASISVGGVVYPIHAE